MASRVVDPGPSWPLLAAFAAVLLSTTGTLAEDRCEGTLCDFYYDHMAGPQQPKRPDPPSPSHQAGTAPAQPSDSLLGRLFSGGAAPQQPGAAAPPAAKRPFVAVQGGGLVGMMQGDAPQRCTGTLCDLYYGGPPPEQPASAPTPAATPAAEEPDEPPTPRGHVRAAPHAERPSCAASASDPWRCYR